MSSQKLITQQRLHSAMLLGTPEFCVTLFSFLLHFVWEFLQVPTFASMAELNHWIGIKMCTAATICDVGFALTAFWVTSAFAKSRRWLVSPTSAQLAIFMAVGILLTIVAEYYYTAVSLRWTYSELMPLVPPFGTGLIPLLQWLVIPPIVIWISRRQLYALHR